MVQGVCFRMETRAEAQRLGVSGYVRNMPDGSVEAVAEGDPAAVESLIDWCRRGPPLARVRDVVVVEEEPTGREDGFRITY